MENAILFITEKKSMIANALVSGLEGAGFTVIRAQTNITEIARIEDWPDIWLLYLQGTDNHLPDILSYTRDKIEERGIRFFAIGTRDELEEVLGGFPSHDLKGTFTRPFRTDEVVDRLSQEATKIKKLSEGKRILVVDDDATMLRTYKDMLSGKYRVYTASSGMNAIQMLVNTEVDLILLDYEMPVIKGPQILEMIRSESHTKNIPVMFLTSKNDRQAIIDVMSLNPANYLLKSLSQSEIMAKIAEFFEGG